jgi:hypothetical protein
VRNREVTHQRWLIARVGLRWNCSPAAGKTKNPVSLRGLRGSGPNGKKGDVSAHPFRGDFGVGKRRGDLSLVMELGGHGG